MRAVDLRFVIMGAAIALFTASGFANAALERQVLLRTAADDLGQIRQLQRIAAQSDRPNLILAGGSNVIYGFDAAQIGRDLGVHAINLGMSNLLEGPGNYENLLRSVVKRGDIVVFADSGWFVTASMHQRHFAARHEDRVAISLARLGGVEFAEERRSGLPVWTLVPESPLAAEAVRFLQPALAARREASGDMKACVTLQSVSPQAAPRGLPAPEIFDRIRRIAALTTQRGATLVLEEPRVLINERQRNAWESYRAALELGLKAIAPLAHEGGAISSPFSADPRQTCDGPFHLRPSARVARSAQLVAWMAKQPIIAELRQRDATKPQQSRR